MADSLYFEKDGKLTELGGFHLSTVIKAMEAVNGARKRVPRLDAQKEYDVILGIQSAGVLLASLMESDHDLAPHLEE